MEDPAETTNLEATHTEKVAELKALLTKYIQDGRSTPGFPQQNDAIESDWSQVDFIN
jgi:hypothetical protein